MIDLVLQGKCDDYTLEIADHYSRLDWANVIISCWYGDVSATSKAKYKTVISSKPANAGLQNRNLQIVSSLNGLKQATSQIAVKLRSDQKISLESLEVMKSYAEKSPDKIMTAGFYKPFPFHPRDHIFWGKTSELIELFDIPLDPIIDSGSAYHDAWPEKGFYSHNVRAEAYICGKYLAKKDPRALICMDYPQTYMHDYAINWDEAKSLSKELMDKFFAPFPKIDFKWPKHGLTSYHYDFAAGHYGEYWAI